MANNSCNTAMLLEPKTQPVSTGELWYKFVATAPTMYLNVLHDAERFNKVHHILYPGDCQDLGLPLVNSIGHSSVMADLEVDKEYKIKVMSIDQVEINVTVFVSSTPLLGKGDLLI